MNIQATERHSKINHFYNQAPGLFKKKNMKNKTNSPGYFLSFCLVQFY